jgi:hypothetical protein
MFTERLDYWNMSPLLTSTVADGGFAQEGRVAAG